MGYYLNPDDVIDIYKREASKPYFVDKTEMLKELIPLVEQQGSYLAVTRPRRFGKSVMAAMIGAFFWKGNRQCGIVLTSENCPGTELQKASESA